MKNRFSILNVSIFAISFFVLILNLNVNGGISEQWNFDTPTAVGVAPEEWSDDSQSTGAPHMAPGPYQVVTTLPSPLNTGLVRFQTDAGEPHRPKIRSNDSYGAGLYEWRVYIPDQQATDPNATISIGAFLFSDQSGGGANLFREIDFEIGPGKATDRASVPNLPANSPICVVTIQQDDTSSTTFDSQIFRPSNPVHHIIPNNWYILSIDISTEPDGRYKIQWFVQRDGTFPRVKARPDVIAGYGANNAFPTDFDILCSLETLGFIGDNNTTIDHQVYFDWVRYTRADSELVTTVIEDFEGFPSAGPYTITGSPNSENVSRFGSSYTSAEVSATVADIEDGAKALRINNNWTAADPFLGFRRHLVGSERDWTNADILSVFAREVSGNGDATIRLRIEEEDGEVWTTAMEPFGGTLEEHEWFIANDLFLGFTGPTGTTPGVLDLTEVAIFDVLFDGGSDVSTYAIDRMNIVQIVGLTKPATQDFSAEFNDSFGDENTYCGSAIPFAGNGAGGFMDGLLTNSDELLLLESGFSGGATDFAYRVTRDVIAAGPGFSFAGVGINFDGTRDISGTEVGGTLTFDAKIGSVTDWSNWTVRLEDTTDLGGTGFQNVDLALTGINSGSFTSYSFPISDFLVPGNDSNGASTSLVDLSILEQIVFDANGLPVAGTYDVDLIIDNLKINNVVPVELSGFEIE